MWRRIKMKMHTKEILKNKADKMVDLIIDEIGRSGEKTIKTSFLDEKNKDTKYVLEMTIKSGDPDKIVEDSIELSELVTRIEALEAKEDADTIFDDTEIEERLTALEEKVDNDTIYDDTEIRAMIGQVDVETYGSLQQQINTLKNNE